MVPKTRVALGKKTGDLTRANQAYMWSFSAGGCDTKQVRDTGVLGAVCSWTVSSTPDAAVSLRIPAEHPGGCSTPGWVRKALGAAVCSQPGSGISALCRPCIQGDGRDTRGDKGMTAQGWAFRGLSWAGRGVGLRGTGCLRCHCCHALPLPTAMLEGKDAKSAQNRRGGKGDGKGKTWSMYKCWKMESPRLVERREKARDLEEEEDNPKSKAKTAGKQAPTNMGKLLGKWLGAEHRSQGSTATSQGWAGEALTAPRSTQLCSTCDTWRLDVAGHNDNEHGGRAQLGQGEVVSGWHHARRRRMLPLPT